MIKRFFYVSGGNTVRQGITFLSQLLLARILGESAFGDLTLAFSWFLIMAAVGDLGTRLYSWRSVAIADTAQRDAEIVRLFGVRLRVALLVAVVLNIAILFLADGRVAVLLHWYTLGVVINQATFDWTFMSRGLYALTFGYTVASGLLYITGLLILVRGVEQMPLVPVMFALSYGVAGMTALLSSLHWRALGGVAHRIGRAEIVRIVSANWRLLVYDLLQRGQSVAIILVASWFYDAPAIARFRIPHLVYGFVAATGVFLASGLFSEIARDTARNREPAAIARGAVFLACLFVPLGFFGDELMLQPLSWFLQGTYGGFDSALKVLVAFMVLAAFTNFAREVSVSAGEATIAVQSYVVSIVAVAIALAAYHPPDVAYLAVVLVGAEAAGLAVVLALRFRRYVKPAVGGAILVSLVVGLGLEQLWSALNGLVADGRRGYLVATLSVGGLFAGYVLGVMRLWASPAHDPG